MTQSQLETKLSDSCELSKAVVKKFFQTLADVAVRETKRTGLFILPGIGRLVKAKRKARIGRNPATGQELKIPAKTVVKFRIAKAAKTAIGG